MTALAYAGSLSSGYIYEDWTEPRLQPWSVSQVFADTIATPQRSLDRWVTRLTQRSAAADATLARSISLALHLLNGWLLWILARPVLSAVGAGSAAALFLLHPAQTEAVAYVASRPDVLTGGWVLLALLASRYSAWLALACAALAVTGKEMGVMALALVPLWAVWTGQRWTRAQMAAWACVAVVMGALLVRGLAVSSATWEVWSPWYVAGQLAALLRLVALWPEALWNVSALTIDHDWTWITKPVALGAVVLWTAAVYRRGWLRFAALFVLTASLPRVIAPLLDGQHERHLYVGSISICLAVGAVLLPRKDHAA